MGEVQNCKLAVVFFGCAVVGLGGVDLVTERAEEYRLTFDSDLCLIAFSFGACGYALVLRAVGSVAAFSAIATVLGVGGQSEICLSIVQSVAIDMVHKHAGRDFEYRAVHGKVLLFYAIDCGSSGCVECFAVGVSVPFMF